MNDPRIPIAFREDIAAMPPVLQQLIVDELDAGNEITSIGHSHPAPPVGAFAMLARPVSTRAHVSDDLLSYRARNSSISAGEFTDGAGFYFVLEPPGPPPEEVGMDAIRAAANVSRPLPQPSIAGGSAAIERFIASTVIDFNKWHDGEGYDLDALRDLSPDEQKFALSQITPPKSWRDVEALEALRASGNANAERALRHALGTAESEVRLAVLRAAPDLVDEATRTASLVRALEGAGSFDGLDATLSQVEEFHPPEVVTALFRGLFTRDGTTACHYAAMLAFVHGKAESSFDWSLRPLFLRFNTNAPLERISAFLALCELLGVESGPLLATLQTPSS